jgi:glutaredoxin-like protein
MALIGTKETEQIRQVFAARLVGDVNIDLWVQPERKIVVPGRAACEYCADTRLLLEELAALSPRLKLAVHEVEAGSAEATAAGVEVLPTFTLTGPSVKGQVRFLGIPGGYEFSTLMEDLIDVSRGATELAEQTLTHLEALDSDVTIKVFVTPTCPYCPGIARLAHQAAMANPRVKAEVVEVSEFPDMGARYGVRGVPKTVINDALEFVGAQPEGVLVQAIFQAVGKPIEAQA